MKEDNMVQDIFDEKGNLLGVFIPKDLWIKIESQVKGLFELQREKDRVEEYKEPLPDWEVFKKCWDFKYPFDFSVECETCGQKTKDWEQDKEKKFILTAANVSGLVSFRCIKCGSKIIKKHFKDKIVSETIPPAKQNK